MTDKRVCRGSPGKQVADAAGIIEREREQDEREEQQNMI